MAPAHHAPPSPQGAVRGRLFSVRAETRPLRTDNGDRVRQHQWAMRPQ